MEKLTSGNRTLSASQVVKVPRGQDQFAQIAAFKGGADSVSFKMKGDTYVAAGGGMDLKGLKHGDPITYRGEQGTIHVVSDQLNSAKDGIPEPGQLKKKMKKDMLTVARGIDNVLNKAAASDNYIAKAGYLAGAATATVIGIPSVVVANTLEVAAKTTVGALRKVDKQPMKGFEP